MNSTNRVLNRLLILLVGFALLAAGIAAILLGTVTSIRDGWKQNAPDVYRTVSNWLETTPLTSTGHSWIWIALALVCVLVIILMLLFIFRQGRGHAGSLVARRTSGASSHQQVGGTVIIDAAVAQQTLLESLNGNTEFVSSSVSTYRIHRQQVLKISTAVRRGVSPPRAADTIQMSLQAWDRLLGTQVPTLIQLSGGVRTRLSSTTRLPEHATQNVQPTAPLESEVVAR
ncbi:hypothetical protein [Glaciibacter psychrotolerans]|uniref:Uncharacterized protein n=1 Tax=Glaciibacter psychrotolerans TaxID=670054 RepID=A0A7Z0EE28_9MICO|nr:hypothetical protein [Leifsonia psychrotolerans]NYJ19495.1 hypothetical protein [Leifsonia psychrotolerans]